MERAALAAMASGFRETLLSMGRDDSGQRERLFRAVLLNMVTFASGALQEVRCEASSALKY
jgi:hypothetical protein